MIKKVLVAALASAALGGCVQNYAARDVEQGLAAGSVAVVNAPLGAVILVDGRAYAVVGTQGAPLSPGRHEVVVMVDGRTIHSQAVFVAAGTRAEVRVP